MLKIWMCRRRGSSLVHDFLRWRSDRLRTRAKPARARARVLCVEGWIIWTPSPSRDPCQLLFWITVWHSAFRGNGSRPLWSELSELWDSQSILLLPLSPCLPLRVSPRSLALSTQWWRSCVVKSWEWTIRQQPCPLLSLRLISFSLSIWAVGPYYPARSAIISPIYSARRHNNMTIFNCERRMEGITLETQQYRDSKSLWHPDCLIVRSELF